VGLYFFVLLSPAQTMIENISLDITTGLIFLVFSYIIGVILSSFSSGTVKQINKLTQYKDIHNLMPDDIFPEEIIKAYKEVMGISENKKIHWAKNHYRMCLMFVSEKMPLISQRIERQRNIALMRRNLIFPLIIWTITGIGWGIKTIVQSSMPWGISLISLSILISVFSIRATIIRMHHGEEIEIRETLSGFLMGYKLGIFTRTNKSSDSTIAINQ
jgi:hypothetical protein